MSWPSMYHLGDLRVTMPLAGAICGILLAARAVRQAAWWCAMLALGLGLVGISKIIYLAWGAQIVGIGWKAASGHATAATAVWPVVLFLLFRQHSLATARAGLLLGCLIGSMVALTLVIAGEHSVAEVACGWCIGAAISTRTCNLLEDTALSLSPRGTGAAVAVALLAFGCVRAMHPGWWMVRTATMLSGDAHPHSWHDC